MSPSRRGIPAKKVARDLGESLGSFMESVLKLVSEFDSNDSAASPAERCRETCAALWAAILMSLDASALGADERETLGTLVFAVLLPLWRKHCGSEKEIASQLHERAQKYLDCRDTHSQIKTATEMVKRLLKTLEVSDRGSRRVGRRLAALFAHRMLGDIHRLNEVKMQFGIQLSMIAMMLSVTQLAAVIDALFRLLRLS
jgi:hypothetical protein